MRDGDQLEPGEGESGSVPMAAAPEASEPAGGRAGLLFRVALAPAVLFVVTVLAFTAAQFGDGRAPAQRWLDRNVGWLLAVEVAASGLLCLMAMAADRRRIAGAAIRGQRSEVGSQRPDDGQY